MGLLIVDPDLVFRRLHIGHQRMGALVRCQGGFLFVLSYPCNCTEPVDLSAFPVRMHWMRQNIEAFDHDLFGSMILAVLIGHVHTRRRRLGYDDGRRDEERMKRDGYPSRRSDAWTDQRMNL